MTSDLTERQAEVLAYLREYIARHGWAPTYREIGERFGFASTNGTADHLKALERKGCIVRGHGHRAIRVVSQEIAP
jgi:repressor LexA